MEIKEEEQTKIKIYNYIMEQKPNKDRFYQVPERVLLYAFCVLSAPALRLYIVLVGQKNGFLANMSLYTNRACIPFEEYNIYINELVEKDFLIINNKNTLTITCPQLAYNMQYEKGEQIKEIKRNKNLT